MDKCYDVSLDDIFEAYFECRKGKRSKEASLTFEINYEENCYELWNDIVNRKYTPGSSIAFIINRPVKREIVSAPFRDRVVYYYIGMRLVPIFEEEFIDESANCRKGKGTSYGINKLYESIREVSNNYTSDCWILKLDFKSFFMSIDKSILWNDLKDFIINRYRGNDINTLLYLIDVTLKNNPIIDCKLRSKKSEWDGLPKHKSMFYVKDGYALPPGNWPSQILANFYLNHFDHMMKDRHEHYGRYVDDFYIVSKDKKKLVDEISAISEYVSTIGLILHPDKIYLQHYTKGVKYIGAVIKMNRRYVSNRTVGNLYSAINRFNKLAEIEGYVESHAESFAQSINSYFGVLRQYQSYGIRRKAISKIGKEWWKVMYVSGHFEKISIKKRFKNNFYFFH